MSEYVSLYTRRNFLTTTVLSVAGASIGAQRVSAAELSPTTRPSAFFRVPEVPEHLESLAIRAIDAAKAAGAGYADVRVAAAQHCRVTELPTSPLHFATDLEYTFGFGVRTLVDGVWGFVHGIDPTVDAVVDAARGAVEQARTNAKIIPGYLELVPSSVTVGTWRTPVQIDPFDVPLHDQMALVGSWGETARRTLGATGSGGVSWQKELRVVATTEGTCVTQHFLRSRPFFSVSAVRLRGYLGPNFDLPTLRAASGGYETVIGPNVHDDVAVCAEEMNRLALLPGKTLDVGRYPAVFDGKSLGNVLAKTIGSAFEMDRVLGEEADASGVSYLSPANDFLGVTTFSPLLYVTASRVVPSVTSAKWDDEGVEIAPSTLIRDGKVADYQTTRSHAPALREWYQRQGLPATSRGCAVAVNGDSPVYVRCNDLTVAPTTTRASMDDLVKDMQRGILVREVRWFSTDQQLSSVSIPEAQFFEVERGRIVHRLGGISLQFATLPFWKSLTALGDVTTVQCDGGYTMKGIPWGAAAYQTSAPAGAFKSVNVVDNGGRV
jgi:TldD protein